MMTGVCSSRPALVSLLKHHAASSLLHFRKLSIRGKLLVFALILFNCVLVALIVIVTPTRIAQSLYDLGQRTREHPLGWLLLATLIQIVSIPPMIGHTTVLNLCGFTYGMKGFLVAAPASLVASTVVFVALRYLFSEVLRSWSRKFEIWKALEAVIDAKGLPLIILIRISPFPPWVYSNSLFASIQSVSVWQFMAATVCSFPRFLLYVFIGSRMASLSDGKQREHMDTETKVVNGILIVAGILSGAAAGWILYALVKRQLQLEGISPKTHGLLSDVLEEPDEDYSLLRNLSSESLHDSV
ncbi:Golgi apparatus membrane protein TVP38 [Russula ochroleuca]|uniref:Golgi apparatus membrane protein TVP38 n=1 Tax=Russula ochroleuca TaxID=152965 RepID=A0A9P5TCA8_9AGAM|nr:Golgi apparatus membrane protein TVP38 [Russula ochroleuca]